MYFHFPRPLPLLLALSIIPRSPEPVPAAFPDRAALVAALDTVIDQHPTAHRTTVALKVLDLESGTVLYDHFGDRLLTPASNLKIYTTACALDIFGPDHQFPTRLIATAPVQKGCLAGDLILIGGGNAMFSTADLANLADRVVHELKIKRIEGRIQVDNSRYAPRLKGPGWMWDDDPDYYNMSVTPLMMDFNVLTVRVTPGPDGTPQALLIPPAAYPPVTLIPADNSQQIPDITRAPFIDRIQVATHGPVTEPVEKRLTMHNPGPWITAVLERMLRDRGVEFVAGKPNGKIRGPSGINTVGPQLVHEGIPLGLTLEHFNRVSENAVGEVLLHEIAIERGVIRPDWPDGAEAIRKWLVETAGLAADSFRLVDGSGLSRYNLISADSSVALLAFMHHHPMAARFRRALPRYSVDLSSPAPQMSQGDQREPGIWRESLNAQGSMTVQPSVKGLSWPTTADRPFDPQRVAAKSGGMTSVSTISGYLTTLAGHDLAFSLLANGYLGSNAPVLDLRRQVWRVLIQYRPVDHSAP